MLTPRIVLALAACAALAWLASPAAAAPGDAPFTTAPDVALEGQPRLKSIAIGDFDNDGRQDLATADFPQSRVHVRLGNGDGTFRPAPTLTGLDRPLAVVVGDFDADGDEDLAVAGRDAGSVVSVLRGKGDGTFGAGTAFPLPGGFARHLATGDFNGDGRTDLVAAAAEHVSVRIAAPDGKFGGGTDISFPAPGEPQNVATGDFDGNGTEDVIVVAAELADGALTILPGQGNGAFGPKQGVVLPGPAVSLAVGDLNGDAKHDVVAPLVTKGAVSVQLGDGKGKLSGSGSLEVGVGDSPVAIATGDFDADGREDMAVVNRDGPSVSVRLGDGAGGFDDGGELPVTDGPSALAVGDFDGDGRADLAVAADVGGTVNVRLGAGEAPLAGNLLVNGGFEQGPANRRPDQAPAAIPGWSTTGGMTAIRYGASPQIGFLGWLDAPRFQTGGTNFLWGGKSGADGVTTASQTVDVGGSARSIDRGRATAGLSAWLGGSQLYLDRMTVTADFLDADGASKGLLRLLPGERQGLTTLQRVGEEAPVPAGTRRIAVTLTSVDNDTVSSAMADNVKLTLDAPGNEPEPAGEPGPGPDGGAAGPGGPGVGPNADREAPIIGRVRLTRRRFAAGRHASRIRYTLSEPAAVTLRIQRAGKGRKRAVGSLSGPGRPGNNRVAFSGRVGRKRLRPGAYRVVVTAVDAAGNRSVAKPRRFRIVRSA